MTLFKHPWKKLRRVALWSVGTLLVALALPLGFLAFPSILLGNEARTPTVVVRYDGVSDGAVEAWAEETDARLRAGGFGNPDDPARIFLFRSQKLYSIFARAARVPPQAQGFGLSFLGNTYVSETGVEALGARTGGSPPLSVWEGSVPHTMAHEVAHLFLIDSIGRSVWKALPQWKQEGFPEYTANIGVIRGNVAASLPRRIAILQDDQEWLGPRSWDRIHYEAGLMVEYLLEIRGLGFREILADSITRDGVYPEMVEWAGGG